MARVLVVIGTRPEGVKLAPVIRGLAGHGSIETRVALTGQHGPLMRQVTEVFNIPVHHDLGIMKEGQDLYDVTAACLTGLREVVRSEKPELIVVEGDTASVFVAGLVGFYEKTQVAHVEAGLRSGDKWRPWPEEIFRRLTGVVADIHFAPTADAARNLLAEGVTPDSIHVTGNTVVDSLLEIADRNRTGSGDSAAGGTTDGPDSKALRRALSSGRRLVLVTAHRRESFGEPMRRAFHALRDLADRFDDIQLLYPVHPNPNVKAAAEEILSGHDRVMLCEPLGYADLVRALDQAVLVITDSGGIQEEAPTLQTPVLVMREVTERPEAVVAGAAALVGTDPSIIGACANAILGPAGWRFLEALQAQIAADHLAAASSPATDAGRRDRDRATEMAAAPVRVPTLEQVVTAEAAAREGTGAAATYPNPYGDGRAGARIADIIASRLTGAPRVTEDWPGPQ